jgi:hypothetical protein
VATPTPLPSARGGGESGVSGGERVGGGEGSFRGGGLVGGGRAVRRR